MRHDMTGWVMHFVHRRDPKNDPREFFSEDADPAPFPFTVDAGKNDRFLRYYDWDDEYPIEPDAYASQVLIKILDDGFIQAGWSFRNKRATIYGPRAAVCFTEMPLSSLLFYAKQRANENVVQTIGIALRKAQFFKAGGRPVIYGLSGDHVERGEHDWPRLLAPECGLGENEQYRYVAFNPERRIDWTHEREWRWSDLNDRYACPGLPIWLAEQRHLFTEALLVVPDDSIAERVLEKLKELRDSGYNNHSVEYRRDLLENTRVVSLESISKRSGSLSMPLRLDDLPVHELVPFRRPKPSTEMIERVKAVLNEAQGAGGIAAEQWKKNAARNARGEILGGFGFSWVEVGNAQSEFVEALIQLKAVEVIGGVGYRLHQMTEGARTGLLDEEEAATDAAVKVLKKHFPNISFSTNWRWD